jgi:hypothetical protein
MLSFLAISAGTMLLSGPLVRRYQAQLQPPAQAFAEWISPPPPNIWKDFLLLNDYRGQARRYYFNLQQMGWEFRRDQILLKPIVDSPAVQPQEGQPPQEQQP